MRVEFFRRDIFWLKGLEDRGVKHVGVGFKGIDATKALALNYGVPAKKIPPRPFMDDFAVKFERFLATELVHYIDIRDGGISFAHAESLAGVGKKLMERVINDWQIPPNAPSTIQRKGFNDPLVETGHMRDHVRVWIARDL